MGRWERLSRSNGVVLSVAIRAGARGLRTMRVVQGLTTQSVWTTDARSCCRLPACVGAGGRMLGSGDLQCCYDHAFVRTCE